MEITMKLNRRSAVLAIVAALVVAGAQAQDRTTQFTDRDGNRVTVTSGQPAPDPYGPPPAFEQLDANRDGSISHAEAEGYIPLLNDYDYLSPHTDRISRRQYDTWVRTHGH